MYNILLIRHGESEQNTRELKDKFTPDHEIHLTERGKEQAYRAGVFLKEWFSNQGVDTKQIGAVRMWVSPYNRTRETAENINKSLNINDIREDEMLVELQFGLFHNLTKEEKQRLFPVENERYELDRRFNGKYYARRPGGESPFDCEIRQKLFIDTLFRDINSGTSPDNVIIVGHGAALNVFRKAFFHYSHEWYQKELNPGNCSIQLITLQNRINTDRGYIYGEPIPEKIVE